MQQTDERNSAREAKDEGILISVFTDQLMLPSEPAGAHKTAIPAGQRLLTDIKAQSQQVVKHGGQMWLCALGQRPPRSYWKNNSRPSKEVRDADQRRVTLGSFLLYCLVTHGFLSRPSGMTKAS